MNRKRNAFTLVELLAVIVILAIVLIIAVPGVLSIINQTKDKAQEQQRQILEEAAKLYVTTDPDIVWVGQDIKMTTVSLDVLKAKGYLDQKIMDPKTKQEITCMKTTVTKIGKKFDYQTEFCDQVNRSPRLSSNMIPIVYDGSKWIKADYTNQNNKWYDYKNQQWANVATVTESTRDAYKKANSGTEVKMGDINAMFVWIPRFKYKLFNVDGTVSPVGNPNLAGEYLIDVQLEDIGSQKSWGTQNGEWLTHPAFTFGGQELEGFWMAKFETGYAGAVTTVEAEKNIVDSTKIIIKPSVYSWRGNTGVHLYLNAKRMSNPENPFGLTKAEDSHLIKNMEWGALVYLTQSKYGKQGNDLYVGAEKQVRINNNNMYLTGCGADRQDAEAVSICDTYETANGMSASTTGNISGVYDTSGGAWDYVAGVMKVESGTDLFVGLSEFDQAELNQLGAEGKYMDVYGYRQYYYQSISDYPLGDATKELGPRHSTDLSSWYDDLYVFPTSEENRPWVVRGTRQGYTTQTGTMASSAWRGNADITTSSRIVII